MSCYALQSIGRSVEDDVRVCKREEDVVEESRRNVSYGPASMAARLLCLIDVDIHSSPVTLCIVPKM